jgi:hypothetical protein
MELPGTAYLYAVATVSITFVGFAALLIVIRQSLGGELTGYDTYFTLAFIKAGFIVTAGALVPPLLVLYGWPEPLVWRVSSVATAAAILVFVASVPARRRAATGRPVPRFVGALLSLQTAAAGALLLNAARLFGDRGAAVYGSAITTMLFASGVAYVLALNVIFQELTKRTK